MFRNDAMVLGLLVCFLAAMSARSNDPGSHFDATVLVVNARVKQECRVSEVNRLRFRYSGAQATTQGSFKVECLKQSPAVQVDLSSGLYFDQSRRMSGPGAERLSYQLFQDQNLTRPFGLAAGGATLSVVPPARVDVYGKIPEGQAVSPGNYNDIVTINLIF